MAKLSDELRAGGFWSALRNLEIDAMETAGREIDELRRRGLWSEADMKSEAFAARWDDESA